MDRFPKNGGALNRVSNKQIQIFNDALKRRKAVIKRDYDGLDWVEHNGSKCLIAECVQKASDIVPRSDMFIVKANL